MAGLNAGARKVRVGIVGIGNCASSFVQGLAYYRDVRGNAHAPGSNTPGSTMPGLATPDVGGYSIADIEVSSAFDVSRTKVGFDVSEAIYAAPNNTLRFAGVSPTGVRVERGPTLDGIGRYLREHVIESEAKPVDIAQVLRQTGTQIVVCYLPVGAQKAAEHYAEQALEAGCGFVNCIPIFMASDAQWRARFEARGLPLVGDDVKSQVGATIVHRMLANLMRERGVKLDRTYQLNFGGNADFLNMLERERLESKKVSKTQAVTSQIGEMLPPGDVHVGPSDHVQWLSDRKWAYIRLEGEGFGGSPISMELKLEVWDSPNSAGVVVDAVRCAKLALDRGIAGALEGPSSYYMKSPPRQFTDDEARRRALAFIAGRADEERRS